MARRDLDLFVCEVHLIDSASLITCLPARKGAPGRRLSRVFPHLWRVALFRLVVRLGAEIRWPWPALRGYGLALAAKSESGQTSRNDRPDRAHVHARTEERLIRLAL